MQEQGIWEPAESLLLAGLTRPGTAVLDMGANVGYYTVALARWLGSSGAVYAFEPEPRNFEVLRVKAMRLGLFDLPAAAVHLLPFAASDRDGQASLNVSHWNLGLHSLVETPPEIIGTIRVPTVTLDTLRFGTPSQAALISLPVDLIKSDAQGAERLILEGGQRLLAQDLPALCLEFEPTRGLAGCLEMTHWLEGHGYGELRLFYANRHRASQTLLELSSGLSWENIRDLAQADALHAYCTLLTYPSQGTQESVYARA